MLPPQGIGGSVKIGRTAVGTLTNWRAQTNRDEKRVELLCEGKFAKVWASVYATKLAKGEEVNAVVTTDPNPSRRPTMDGFIWTGKLISMSEHYLVLHIEKQETVTTT